MGAPVIVVAGAMAGSSILNYILNQKTTRAQLKQSDYVSDYTRRYNAENDRFWADYKKNTGFSPRYPMRSGAEYNLTALYGAQTSRAGAIASQLRSTANVGLSGVYGGSAVYQKLNKYNYSYW